MSELMKKIQEDNCPRQAMNIPASNVVHDVVNKPKHYMLFADGMESFDVIALTLDPKEYVGFLKGNILKYRLRAGKKGDADICIAKSDWYAAKLEDFVNQQEN